VKITSEDFYRQLSNCGLNYGATYRVLSVLRLCLSSNRATAVLSASEACVALDGCLQILVYIACERLGSELIVPTGLQYCYLSKDLLSTKVESRFECTVRVYTSEQQLKGDCDLFLGERLVAKLRCVSLARMPVNSNIELGLPVWTQVRKTTATSTSSVAVICDANIPSIKNCFDLDTSESKIDQVVQNYDQCTIFLGWGRLTVEVDISNALIKWLASVADYKKRVVIATRGVQSASSMELVSTIGSSAWGIAATARKERNLACACIDFEGDTMLEKAVNFLSQQSLFNSPSFDFAVREKHLWSLSFESKRSDYLRVPSLQSKINDFFDPSNLELNTVRVRIVAAGLNFRDVLINQNLYPEKGLGIGLEFSGVVIHSRSPRYQVGAKVLKSEINCLQVLKH